jgi:hypothetical protein
METGRRLFQNHLSTTMKSCTSAIALGAPTMSFCIPVVLALSLLTTAGAIAALVDMRDITRGVTIADEGYCDQPYVVVAKDGNWLCTLAYKLQHVVAIVDAGQRSSASSLMGNSVTVVSNANLAGAASMRRSADLAAARCARRRQYGTCVLTTATQSPSEPHLPRTS